MIGGAPASLTPSSTRRRWRAYWAAGDRRGGRLPERRCEPRNPDEYAQLVAVGKVFGLNLRAAAEPFFAYGVAAVTVTDLDPVTISVAWRGGDPPPNLDGLREVVRGLQDTTAPQP